LKLVYVDTSCLVAIAFGEAQGARVGRRLREADRRVSSALLEAELSSALKREGLSEGGNRLLSWITWVHPDRRLASEIARVLEHGYLRGADLWHLACALFVVDEPDMLTFLTLDTRQQEVAAALGFHT
jgi:predicted nucleic acid-binding protein